MYKNPYKYFCKDVYKIVCWKQHCTKRPLVKRVLLKICVLVQWWITYLAKNCIIKCYFYKTIVFLYKQLPLNLSKREAFTPLWKTSKLSIFISVLGAYCLSFAFKVQRCHSMYQNIENVALFSIENCRKI